MECALKSSLIKPEMRVKATQQQQTAALLLMEEGEEIWKTAPQNGVAVDDFFVDDLLDFSKAAEEEIPEDNQQQQQQTLPLKTDDHKNPIFQLQPNDPNTHHDLYVPADDVADLEWLSHFVDDSASGYSLTLPPAKLGFQNKPTHKKPIFTTPVQTKTRTKRAARTGHRVWSNSLTDSSASSSSTSSSSPAAANPWAGYGELTQSVESLFGKPPPPARKKMVKKQAKDVGAVVSGGARRCSHCLVQKTPQWRSGPLGAKTLCNACGVRYKSGRLLPEYRPACSPTYSREIHSNNHRKVMEMRRKKEGFGSPVVESF